MENKQLNMLLNPNRLRLQKMRQKYSRKGVSVLRKRQFKIFKPKFKPDLKNDLLLIKQNKSNLGDFEMRGNKLLKWLTELLNPNKLTSDKRYEFEKGGECKMSKSVFRKLNKTAAAIFAFAVLFAFNAVNASAEASAENNSPQIIVNTQTPEGPEMFGATAISRQTVNVSGEVIITNDNNGALTISGSQIETKIINDVNELTVSGADKLILSFSKAYNTLSSLTIEADEVTSANVNFINIADVGLTIKASKVSFAGLYANPLEILVRFLNVEAIVEDANIFSKIASVSQKVIFENVNINASEHINIEARVTEKSVLEETAENSLGDELSQFIQTIDGTTKYLVNVRPVYTEVGQMSI